MKSWRWTGGLALFLLAGLPLLMPLDSLRRFPESWRVWAEADRIAGLATNSAALCLGSALVSVSGGLILGALLFKTDLPGRRLAQGVLILTAFVPLPLVTTACQMGFRTLLPIAAGSVWPTGLGPAILIHGLLGLPWCAVIIGLGLRWVEPELEEDGLLCLSPTQVFLRVSLRRALPFTMLAGLATVLTAWNEMAVTDFARVRTFAEEVYLQFQGGGVDERARAAAATIPFVVGIAVVTVILVSWWRTALPEARMFARPPRLFHLGPWRWPTAVATYALGLAVLTPLLFGLILRAGLRYATADHPGDPTWDGWLLLGRYCQEWVRQRELLFASGMMAAGTGLATAFFALFVSWLSRGSMVFDRLLWLTAAALWATPGPLLGMGWLDLVQRLLELPGGSIVRLLLYERPSPLPNMWVCTIRFLPIALAVLWPLVRLIPRELEDAAAADGLGPLGRFRRVIVPLAVWPVVWTALIVAALTLGEISASKLTATPGFTPLAHHVFQQMHASADAELAALTLVLLTLVAAGGGAVVLLLPRLRRDVGRWAE